MKDFSNIKRGKKGKKDTATSNVSIKTDMKDQQVDTHIAEGLYDSTMCCKDCGDEMGKPTKLNAQCMYDGKDPQGENWIKKESYYEEVKHSPMHIKQAIGIATDPRYKGGNMTGAVKTMNKLSKDIHKHPKVAAVLKRVNEAEVNEISRETKDRYVSRASSQAQVGAVASKYLKGAEKAKNDKMVQKRQAGIKMATESAMKMKLIDKMKKASPAAKKALEAPSRTEEKDPATPNEQSMAIRQAEFIEYVGKDICEHLRRNEDFPEWMQNKLSGLHTAAKDLHAALGNHGKDKDMNNEEMTDLNLKAKLTKAPSSGLGKKLGADKIKSDLAAMKARLQKTKK